MQTLFKTLTVGLALTAIAAFAQTMPTFEVATVKPAAPLDVAKIQAALQAGGKMPVGVSVDSRRAEYLYVDLKTLIARAYSVKPYQITGPDWLGTTRFDIIAKIPDGASKEDEPKMLQSLLEDRFKLTTHRTSGEHPVLALVVGKGGIKMKESAQLPVAIDESVPLKPGEIKTEGPDGPVRVTVDMKTGSSVVDLGLKGKMSQKMNPATQTMHIDFSMTTMGGFADMLTQIFTQLGGTAGRQIVDMTNLKGHYEASLDLSLADLIAMARNAGVDVSGAGQGQGPGNPGAAVNTAPDPGGSGLTVGEAVQSLGLKLESRKAVVDQFVIDHIEKTPTEN